MKIMTLNVNRFDGEKEWYGKNDLDDRDRKEKFDKVIKYVLETITNESDIAILQEFPFLGYLNGNIDYNNKEIDKWKKLIEEKKLQVHLPNSKKDALNVTVAVTTKSTSWKPRKENKILFGKYGNEYIELYTDSLNILGLHLKNGASELYDALDKISEYDRPNIIIGDFNSGDYEKESPEVKENRKNYKRILEEYGYSDVCYGKNTRRIVFENGYEYYTPIDHILLKQETDKIFSHGAANVSENYTLSDHCPITFELTV